MSHGRAVLIVSPNKWRLARGFARMQEHYDSPEFRGQIFTVSQLRKWNEKIFGSFTYYDDWTGFNFPSSNLIPFYAGFFPRLSLEERALLRLLERAGGHEYVAGAVQNDNFPHIVRHEYGHIELYFSFAYREEITEVLRKQRAYPELRKIMLGLQVYHSDVIDDEIVVYSVSGTYEWLGPDMERCFQEIKNDLGVIHKKYFDVLLADRAVSDLLKYMKVVEL